MLCLTPTITRCLNTKLKNFLKYSFLFVHIFPVLYTKLEKGSINNIIDICKTLRFFIKPSHLSLLLLFFSLPLYSHQRKWYWSDLENGVPAYRCLSRDLLGMAWSAFAALELQNFSCPVCKASPSVIICDGLTLSYGKRHRIDSSKPTPPEGFEIFTAVCKYHAYSTWLRRTENILAFNYEITIHQVSRKMVLRSSEQWLLVKCA